MKHITQIVIFLLANALGFLSVFFCYFIGAKSGVLAPSDSNFDHAAFKTFLTGTMLTWLACAVFSLAYFFLKGKERLFFLWAPVVIPMGYGLYVLSRLFSS